MSMENAVSGGGWSAAAWWCDLQDCGGRSSSVRIAAMRDLKSVTGFKIGTRFKK